MLKLNHLETVASDIGYELVIENINGDWIITENLLDCLALELPLCIGSSEETAEIWLLSQLKEKEGE